MSFIASLVPRIFFPCFSVHGKALPHAAQRAENHRLVWEVLQSCSFQNWSEAISYHGLALVSPCSLSLMARIYGLSIFWGLLKGRNRIHWQFSTAGWEKHGASINGSHRHLVVRRENSCEKRISSCLLHATNRYHYQSVKYFYGKRNQRKETARV